jgi:hypothetical protein
MKENEWLRLLTCVTGLVSQELLLQNEYLAVGEQDPAGTSSGALVHVGACCPQFCPM